MFGVVRAPACLPEAGVVVEGDLAVEGEDLSLPAADERIHLDEEGVLADQDLPEPYEDVDGLLRQSGRLGDLARLRGGDALGGVDGDAGHGVGTGGGNLLDLHAAFRRGDREEAARRAVEYIGHVELGLDVHGLGQHHLADPVPLDVHTEDLTGGELGGGRVGGELHTACLAPATGLHLSFHHDPAAEPACDLTGLLG